MVVAQLQSAESIGARPVEYYILNSVHITKGGWPKLQLESILINKTEKVQWTDMDSI